MMDLFKKKTYRNGRMWVLNEIWFDEIMQLIYINTNEKYVYNHARRQGEDKYSLREKRFTIAISINTPQVANILKEQSIKEAIAAVDKIWENYLDYALKQIAPNLISFTQPYESTPKYIVKDKLTKQEVRDALCTIESVYNEKIQEFNPYKE